MKRDHEVSFWYDRIMNAGQSLTYYCLGGRNVPGCDSFYSQIHAYSYGGLILGVLAVVPLAYLLVRHKKMGRKQLSIVLITMLGLGLASAWCAYKYKDITTVHCIRSGPIEEC